MLIRSGIFSVIYFSILLAASLTISSVFPYTASSIGESNDGPPSTGLVSTIIPGISFVEFVTSSMTSNPDIDLSYGGAISINPLPILSAPLSHQLEPARR